MRNAFIDPNARVIAVLIAMVSFGCSKEEPKPAPPAKSAAAVAAPAPTPSVPAPAPTPSEPAPQADCPKGSSGEGSFNKPCEATGTSRMMEVTWTGKTDDKGPSFRVVNKSETPILFGKIAVYFYDKSGKQLDVPNTKAGKEPEGTEPKTKPFHSCSGNMFGGVMKGNEKAVITFSCVKKAHVPEGATAIEAEMQMVGFTDETEKKISHYWRNNELVPEQRKKGGIKKK